MRELPSGTVTFLFTDIEGSTRLLTQHGPSYADLLADHRRTLRACFEAHGGVEVDTQGDAFFVAFRAAGEAVAAATEARKSLAGGPIDVRMGIHTGEPIVTDEGYVGLDVHRAARIAAAAHGGQIVCSETTRRLLDTAAPVRELGLHRLKDLIDAERLYQLGDGDFPPLRTLDATNLPTASSAIIGREREVTELVSLLSNGTRLLTVTGPGGTGKTRLALQVAAELVGALHDGVFWVSLAGLKDPDVVVAEIAQTIGAPDDVTGFLRGRELLILLDNFEHLLAGAPALATMLEATDRLRLLVTSRAPLHIAGEREYRLEPLAARDAAAFFVERARATGREISPGSSVVEAICRRLDGLPLALELAAARTRLLAPERLLERLDEALPVLTGGRRDAPERQRTLRATIEWSYDLLDDEAKLLLARLAVFAGGFSLTAAEEVADADLDGLAALVDLSLLKPIGDDRFLMLETIREFALERAAGEEPRGRHAAHFSAMAEQAYERRFEAEAEWATRLDADHDNLRAALDHLRETDPDGNLAAAGALGWFWITHGHLAEGSARLQEALARSTVAGSLRARALTAAGSVAAWLGDGRAGRQAASEGIALWRELGDMPELAAALDGLGWLLFFAAGEDDAALEAFEQCLALRRELGDARGEVRALVGVCQMLVAVGDTERAESLSRELLQMQDRDARSDHFAYHYLADCALMRDDCAEAERRYRESLRAALPLGDFLETSFEVQGVAMSAAGLGDARRALVLAGAVEALWESLGARIGVNFWDALLARYLGAAREQLGGDAEAVWAEGRATPFDDAVELALGSLDER